MSTTERQDTILNLLEQHRFLTVKRLSELTYTSPSSIRRDLSHLENLYFIKRSHGGASIADGMNHPANLMNRMKMNTSDVIINTKRKKSHIGMLYSDYATFFCDTCENTVEKRRDFLSDGERAAVERFIADGGKVFECPVTIADVVCANRGYIEYSTPHDNYNLFCTAYELSQYDLEKPFARCDNPLVALQTSDGDGCKILSHTNISCQNKPQNLTICLSESLNSAVLCTPDCRKGVKISDGRVKIDGLADGGILILS